MIIVQGISSKSGAGGKREVGGGGRGDMCMTGGAMRTAARLP